ncbi:MAG: hypothetical protein KME29_19000 [Calothrix sp. FI2-JRJ7]|nr:hypothetical protein [Calothrix sp. FI2-JRJ7]
MEHKEVRAGTSVIMTHAERQAFLKQSPLGKLLGVSQVLPQPSSEDCDESANKVCDAKHIIHR